jgi:NAD(P)-dependent dehydrogenase (short-subunit alcohol dehydrogenase family)
MGRLEGKVALITGAAGGIMGVTAAVFARESAKIVVADIAVEGGEETVDRITRSGGDAVFVKTDVSNEEEVKRSIRATVDKYGKLNLLVNGAGVDLPDQLSTVECSEEVFDKTYAVNLKGTWLVMKHVFSEMAKSGGGAIINVSSIAAHIGYPSIPAYSASKGGIISLSRVAAIEFASKNVRVNCISPGPIRTPMIVGQWGEEGLQQMAELLPRKKIGEMEDIANVALFLASDESANVIGHTLVADGGMKASSHVSTK